MGLRIPHYQGKIQAHSVLANENNVLTESSFEHYRNVYIQTFIQLTLNSELRFYQPYFERCKQTERLLLKSSNGENYSENHEAVNPFYNTDIDISTRL